MYCNRKQEDDKYFNGRCEVSCDFDPCCKPCPNDDHKPHPDKKASAQFTSGINLMPPAVGQEITGYWPLGNVEPVEFGVTSVADSSKIQLSGNNTIILQPGRYLVSAHALVANYDDWDPQGSDPIITKLFLNGQPLDYTINSVDVMNQMFILISTQLNKTNIIVVSQPNSTLQWMAGNTVSADFHFDLYEASLTVSEI